MNKVEAALPAQGLLKLFMVRMQWKVLPDLSVGAAAWILAGGAHHTDDNQNLTSKYLKISPKWLTSSS